MSPEPTYPEKGIHRYVRAYIRALPDLVGKTVLDIPCGDGRASHEFRRKGARVIALDLFPETMRAPDISAKYADLTEPLPLEDDSVDYLICQEGIEHVPNQLQVLQEFNRVLRRGGKLLLTTPNNSHLRARVSHCLLETDLLKRMPPTEIDSVWFAEADSDRIYFGHLFLLGVQHLQSLLTLTGFTVEQRVRTDFSTTSLLLGIPLYPLLSVVTLGTYFRYRGRNPHVPEAIRRQVLWERVRLNLSPQTLFCKHLFWVCRKTETKAELVARLKTLSRGR